MNPYTAPGRATPTKSATGTEITRHRRDRQPIATTRTTAVITCTVTGIQPCIKDIPGQSSTIETPGLQRPGFALAAVNQQADSLAEVCDENAVDVEWRTNLV